MYRVPATSIGETATLRGSPERRPRVVIITVGPLIPRRVITRIRRLMNRIRRSSTYRFATARAYGRSDSLALWER